MKHGEESEFSKIQASPDQPALKDAPNIDDVEFLPFVDRERELRYLSSFVEKALSGEGDLVFLTGDAGIGKTRLAHALRKSAEKMGASCLTSKCHRSDGATSSPPYPIFAEFMRQFADRAPVGLFAKACGRDVVQVIRLVPELADLFALSYPAGSRRDASPGPPENLLREEALFLRAIAGVFFRISEQSPLLLIIDDWQCCDQSSLKLLQFMRSGGLYDHPIVCLCAYRDREVLEEGVPRLVGFVNDLDRARQTNLVHLERFDREGLSELLSKAFSKRLVPSSDLLDLVFAKSGGNPLFVDEILKSLVDQNLIVRNGAGDWEAKRIPKMSVPRSTRSVIKHRLSRLQTTTLRVLEAASVIGEEFGYEVLQGILRKEATSEEVFLAIDEAVSAGLVQKTRAPFGAPFSFSDGSIMDILSEDQSALRRKTFHEEIANVLVRTCSEMGAPNLGEHAGEIATHFLLAGNLELSLRYLVMAGERSAGLYAHAEACKHYELALGLPEDLLRRERPDLRPELIDRLGDEYYLSADLNLPAKLYEEAADSYRELKKLKKAALVYTKLGNFYHTVTYDIERSVNSYRRAIELLEQEGTQSEELALTYVTMMNMDIWNSDHEKALADYKQAMRTAERQKIPRVTSGALTYRTSAMSVKEADKADAMCRRAIAIAREHDLPLEASNAYFVRAVEHGLVKGPSDTTERIFLEGIEYASKVDFFLAKVFLKAELAFEVYLARGELKRARELAEECFASVSQLPRHSLPGLVAISTLGQVLLAQGELAESRELLSEVESATRGFGVLQLDAPLYMALARASFEMGDHRKGLAYLAEGRRLAKKRGLTVFNARPFVQVLSETAESLFAYDELDLDGANAILGEISRAANEIDARWPSAYVSRVQSIGHALQGDWVKAIESLKRGSSLWKELGWRYESARANLQISTYYQKVYEFKAAESACEEAIDAFRKMGAKKDAENAESSMNALAELAAQHEKARAPELDGDGQTVFDYLAGAFISDYAQRRLPVDRAGWRTFGEVARATGLPRSSFYPGPRNAVLKALEDSKAIETRVFSGERGRGGEVTRARVAYEKDSRTRDYIGHQMKNKPGALGPYA